MLHIAYIIIALLLSAIVAWALCSDSQPPHVRRIIITLLFSSSKIHNNMVKITTDQRVRGAIGAPVDKKGNATSVQPGSVSYKSSDVNVASVFFNPNNDLGFVITGNAPGVARIDITADADLGEGVTPISGFFGVEVTAGMAVGFGEPTFEPAEIIEA